MANIITRAGKGASLSWNEADANFINLNNDKLEASALAPYLTSATAASTYETQDNAAATYETQTHATNTYATKISPTTSGVLTHSGDVLLSGTGKRITGDFSNATVANRVMFQTSTLDGNSLVGLVPNGSGTVSSLDLHSTADPTNTSRLSLGVVGSSDTRITSDALGSGTALPMTFYAGGSERMRIDTSGSVNVTSPAGLGYGTGSGGTVTQATSKSTAVTLNKPTGQITMNDAALAAGARVIFQVSNGLVTEKDSVLANYVDDFGANYRVEVQAVWTGYFQIGVTNITAGSLSQAVRINFAIIKGANV